MSGPLNYTTELVNGQLVPLPAAQAFNPLTFGAQYTGPSMWPVGSQYNVPPILPSPTAVAGQTGYSPDMGGYQSSSDLGHPAPTSSSMSGNGRVNWYHPTKSPVLWAVGFVVFSLFMLHKVHYKRG